MFNFCELISVISSRKSSESFLNEKLSRDLTNTKRATTKIFNRRELTTKKNKNLMPQQKYVESLSCFAYLTSQQQQQKLQSNWDVFLETTTATTINKNLVFHVLCV